MSGIGIIGLLLVMINIIFSYKGLRNNSFFENYKFEVDRILIDKEYKRLFTSAFLHVSWAHLIFNIISLLAFAGIVERQLGDLSFLTIYFGSLLGGNLFSLLIHRQHGDYSAVGASGAIGGIIFASIAILPGLDIGIFFIPLAIPGWLFGLVYILYTIYGIKSEKNNIGHDAHLGGALIGMFIGIAFSPESLTNNLTSILIITLPAILFLSLIIIRPHTLLIDNLFFKSHIKNYSIDQKYNVEKKATQHEIDKILDKINTSGIESLSKKEKEALEKYSKFS